MLESFVLQVSAIVTAAAATYSANRVRLAVETVQKADRRSKKNRELLVGDPAATDPVIERIERIERKVRDQ